MLGIRQRSGTSHGKGPKSGKGRGICVVGEIWLWCELRMNCDVRGHVLRSSYNLPVLYLYCNAFFIRDVHKEFVLIFVHLFDLLPAISSWKVGDFFAWRVVILHNTSWWEWLRGDSEGGVWCFFRDRLSAILMTTTGTGRYSMSVPNVCRTNSKRSSSNRRASITSANGTVLLYLFIHSFVI